MFAHTRARLGLTYVVGEVARVGGDLWLGAWTTPPDEATFPYPSNPPFGNTADEFFLWTYVMWGFAYCVVMLIRNRTSMELNYFLWLCC